MSAHVHASISVQPCPARDDMPAVGREDTRRRRPMMTPVLAPALLTIALAGCMSPLTPASFAGGSPEMRPETFFAGPTSSSGELEDRGGAPTRILHVEGSGQALPDGRFQLVQQVRFDTDPPKTRTWVMRRLDDHHYTSTLTDASGPVEGEAYGNLFHLSYPMASPFGGRMEQWLYLQPDGRTVVNEATITVLGVVVARLSERITHEAAAAGGK